MRLLFVIDQLSSGGAQRQMTTLALELSRRGHEIELFVYGEANFHEAALRRAGVAVHRHTRRSGLSPGTLLALRRRLRGKPWDAALSFLTVPNLYTELARLGLQAPPLVVSERFCFPAERPALGRIAAHCHALADRVVTNSFHLFDHYRGRHSWARTRLETIWNGVDLVAFPARPLPPHRDVLALVAIGAVTPRKNAACLVRALAFLGEQHGLRPRLDWVARRASAVTAAERAHRQELDELIHALGVGDQWRWLDETQDVASVLDAHHALVHPSHREGLPNVVCEALASGRPAVVSDALDHPRLVQDGKTGLLFRADDAKSLASALHRLHGVGREALEAMGTQARTFAERELPSGLMADRYERLFRKLTGT